jgi:myosin heavy subunit
MSNTTQNLAELKKGLAKIKALEDEFADAKWNQSPSPKAVAEFQASLLERYHQAKALYMQRRMEKVLVDHVGTYDPTTNEFDIPQMPWANDEDGGDDGDLEAQHAQALASLETTVQSVHAKLSTMRNTYQAICSRRQELEEMVKDLERDDSNDDEEDTIGEETSAKEEDIAAEQQKIEELQQRKAELQEHLDRLRREKEERTKRISEHRGEVALLRQEQLRMNLAGKDPEEFRQKIQQLKEMKEFYDSLREVLEELGGVKIEQVKEDQENQHLILTVLLFEKYKVEIEMEVYRKTLLKLVNANWATSPLVSSSELDNDDLEPFSISMNSLDDLVQVAKTSMGPPHDVRFIIRESCARIHIMQSRVEDFAILRRRVLTKVVGNDQVACSLNEGIVIVMRLYDQWVRLEQIVGVNGWDEAVIKRIRSTVPERDEKMKPSLVVELVQKEIRRMQEQEGFVIPKTPVLPKRKETNDE